VWACLVIAWCVSLSCLISHINMPVGVLPPVREITSCGVLPLVALLQGVASKSIKNRMYTHCV